MPSPKSNGAGKVCGLPYVSRRAGDEAEPPCGQWRFRLTAEELTGHRSMAGFAIAAWRSRQPSHPPSIRQQPIVFPPGERVRKREPNAHACKTVGHCSASQAAAPNQRPLPPPQVPSNAAARHAHRPRARTSGTPRTRRVWQCLEHRMPSR